MVQTAQIPSFSEECDKKGERQRLFFNRLVNFQEWSDSIYET